jgi:hypothetical protein
VDYSAVALSAVAAVGTLTPLVLGLLNYIKDKKKDAANPAIPAPAMGETVDFESVAVQSLNAQIKMLDKQLTAAESRNGELKAQRDANAEALRAAGLPLPRV